MKQEERPIESDNTKTCQQGMSIPTTTRQIKKKRKQQVNSHPSTTFEFIGNGKLKVLETTGNNSMFAVFQLNSKTTSSPMEGVLLMKGRDMEGSYGHRRRKVSTPTPQKSSKQQHVSNMMNSFSSTSSESSTSPNSPLSYNNNHVISTNNSVITSTTTKPPIRFSISINEILN